MDTPCKIISQQSFCDRLGIGSGFRTCSIPCDPTVGCVLGTCELTYMGFICKNIPTDEDQVFAGFTKVKWCTFNCCCSCDHQCLLDNVDPYLAVAIRDQVKEKYPYDPALEPFEASFKSFLTDYHCLTPQGELEWLWRVTWCVGTNYPLAEGFTEEQCLAAPGWCPHRNCNLALPQCAGKLFQKNYILHSLLHRESSTPVSLDLWSTRICVT